MRRSSTGVLPTCAAWVWMSIRLPIPAVETSAGHHPQPLPQKQGRGALSLRRQASCFVSREFIRRVLCRNRRFPDRKKIGLSLQAENIQANRRSVGGWWYRMGRFWASHAALILLAITMLLPFLWMVLAS